MRRRPARHSFSAVAASIVPTNVTLTSVGDTFQARWTPPNHALYDFQEVEIDPTPATPTATAIAALPAKAWVTIDASSAFFVGNALPCSSGGAWQSGAFGTDRRVRVRGYSSATDTYGPWSDYSLFRTAFDQGLATEANTRFYGAQNPDGVAIGVPEAAVLAAAVAGDFPGGQAGINQPVTISNKIISSTLALKTNIAAFTVIFNNCLFLPGVLPDRLNNATGLEGHTQVQPQSEGGVGNGKIILNNCQGYGGGPAGYDIFAAYHDITANNCLFHGYSNAGLFLNNPGNNFLTDVAVFGISFKSYNTEIAAFSHRDALQTTACTGVQVFTRVWSNVNADSNGTFWNFATQGDIQNYTIESCWTLGGHWGVAFRDLTGGHRVLAPIALRNHRFCRWPYGYFLGGSIYGAKNVDMELQDPTVVTYVNNRYWEPNPTKPADVPA